MSAMPDTYTPCAQDCSSRGSTIPALDAASTYGLNLALTDFETSRFIATELFTQLIHTMSTT